MNSFLNFIRNHSFSLSILTLVGIAATYLKIYSDKSIDDGVIHRHGENAIYVSEVSKIEREILDSTMRSLYGEWATNGSLKSNNSMGYYSLILKPNTQIKETPQEILKEIVTHSGLTIENKIN